MRHTFILIEAVENVDEIWVIARREDRLKALAEEVKTPLKILALDLSKQEDIAVYSAKLKKENPTVKYLINCAGFGKFGHIEKMPAETQLNMIDLNCKAVVSICAETLPYTKEGSKIINVSSCAAFQPIPYINVYAATKAFVLSYSRALNVELKYRKVSVTAVCPYWVKTEFFIRANEEFKIKKLDVLYEPEFIAKKAFRALDKTKKDYIVPGAYAKLILFAAKILPHKLIMKIMDKKFRFEKQNV